MALQGAQLLPERGHQLNEGVKLGVAPLLALVGEVLEINNADHMQNNAMRPISNLLKL